MDAKPWWQSRTVWFNGVSLVVAVAGALIDPSLALDSRVVTGLTVLITVGNVVLRTLTAQPIAGTPAERSVKRGRNA